MLCSVLFFILCSLFTVLFCSLFSVLSSLFSVLCFLFCSVQFCSVLFCSDLFCSLFSVPSCCGAQRVSTGRAALPGPARAARAAGQALAARLEAQQGGRAACWGPACAARAAGSTIRGLAAQHEQQAAQHVLCLVSSADAVGSLGFSRMQCSSS